MDEFYEYICKKATHGIPYLEAIQFMFWMFLTVGYLPKEFRNLELSKANLAILFSRLSRSGKIIIDHGAPADQIVRPEHWEGVIENFLQKKIIFDETFPQRCAHYL